MSEETAEKPQETKVRGIKIAGSRLPPPRFKMVQDTGSGKNAYKFFQYWRAIQVELHEFVAVKVYRLWPVINLKANNPGRKTITWEVIEGECPFTAEGYIQEALERWGSGGWSMILNEAGISGSIMECRFESIDMDAFPPKIDLKTLVVGAFQNKWYIDWLKQNRIPLPWEKGEGESEEEGMTGVSEALKVMVEHGQRMADKNVEMAEQVADAKIAAFENQRPAEPEEGEHATRESIRVIADGAREAISMVKEASGKQYDAVEIITAVGGLLKSDGTAAAAAGSNSKDFIEITKLLLETQAKGYEAQIGGLKDTLDTIKTMLLSRDPAVAATGVVPAAPKSLIDQMKEAREIADFFGGGIGNGNGNGHDRDRDDEPTRVERPPEKSLASSIAENLPAIGMILMAGANIFYNMKLKPGEAPQNPAEALKQSPLAGAVPGAAPAGAAPADAKAQWMQVVAQIRGPFLAHFFSTENLPVGRDLSYKASGYTLAYFICTDGTGARITDAGRRFYMAIAEQLGPRGLDQLIRQDHEIWSKIQGMPQRYVQFMSEFFTYDTWLQNEAEGGGDSEEPPVAPPAAAA